MAHLQEHASNLALLANFLAANPEVRYIRYQWVDLFGILRVRLVPKSYSMQLASTDSPLVLPPFANGLMVDDVPMPDTKPAGRDSLIPDWSSLRKTNFGVNGDHYASVMCWVSESNCEEPDVGVQRCPRTLLGRVLSQAKELCNLDIVVGFEVEFIVMGTSANGDRHPLGPADAGARDRPFVERYDPYESSSDLYPHGVTGYSASSVRDKSFRYVEECVEALEALSTRKVNVLQFHSENTRSQYEISMAPLPAMEAVDSLVSAQETIKNVFAKHGYQATMYPKPFAELGANGSHMHLSISPTDLEDHFLAGLLRRLPALCAITFPVHDSYERVSRLYEAGEIVGWGWHDRTLPIRKIKTGHWELRFVDGTTNMYLALAACVAAGLQGARKREELLWKDGASVPDRKLSDSEKMTDSDPDLYRPLPKSLDEALGCLKESSGDLAELMGDKILERYIQMKEVEHGKSKTWDPEKRRRLYLQKFT
ncbi:MAG: hypothetical protein M1816_007010 [Peltula sp. TS41687]|nr:MAG: hypothetical protein M1816_007010 [Peltula sp. TS41687]